MKKWWVLALLCTLALSLTSCSKKKNDLLGGNNNFQVVAVDGNLGNFDAYLIPTANQGLYELVIMPVAVQPGDIVSIAIANNSSAAYRVVVPQAVVNPDQEIFAGNITDGDLANFDLIAIVPFSNSCFLCGTTGLSATGELPLPGSSIGNSNFQ